MWELDSKVSWAPKIYCFWTVVLEKTLESPLDGKEIQPVHPKENQSWIFIGRTYAETETIVLASWCKELTHLKRPWCWERLKAGGEGNNRGWYGWMAPLIQWKWVWVNSGSWQLTRRPGVLQSIGSQKVGQDWATELNWILYTMGDFISLNKLPYRFMLVSIFNSQIIHTCLKRIQMSEYILTVFLGTIILMTSPCFSSFCNSLTFLLPLGMLSYFYLYSQPKTLNKMPKKKISA